MTLQDTFDFDDINEDDLILDAGEEYYDDEITYSELEQEDLV